MKKTISKLSLKPGDVLVVTAVGINRAAAEKLSNQLRSVIVPGSNVIVCNRAMAFSVVQAGAVTTGWDLIQRERRRQISAEGYTHAHDNGHRWGELRKAAECYERPEVMRAYPNLPRCTHPVGWPWESKWWKPSPQNRLRELIKAGALYLAESERLHRAGRKPTARLIESRARSVGRKIDRILHDCRNWDMIPAATAPVQEGAR